MYAVCESDVFSSTCSEPHQHFRLCAKFYIFAPLITIVIGFSVIGFSLRNPGVFAFERYLSLSCPLQKSHRLINSCAPTIQYITKLKLQADNSRIMVYRRYSRLQKIFGVILTRRSEVFCCSEKSLTQPFP